RLALNPRALKPQPCHIASRTNEAFIVYTSGSTGKPKGVPVLHQGAVNTIFNQPHGFHHYREGNRLLQIMAIGFDGCQRDTWKALSHGATLVLRGNDMFDAMPTIDIISTTPTGIAHLGDPKQYPRLKLIAHGGEQMPSSLKDLWADHVSLMNCYGPSECAIETHVQQLTKYQPTTIGRPINNVTCYVLDASLRPVPIGVVGEIFLGGMGVSPGYINRPDESTYRFVPIVLGGDSKLVFRTGDLGRLMPNGHFEVLGREDTQVKLKGYRIELDEVANAMMQHVGVVSAAVIVKDKTHLVGYFTPASVNVEALRETVVDLLPVYMVPVVWVGLDVMPQNANGKIDKLVLAAMEVADVFEPVESEMEAKVAAVWAQVLDVSAADIGRQSSFYALGGDSLSVVKVVAASKLAGVHLTASDLLKAMVLWRVAAVATIPQAVTTPSAKLSDEAKASIQQEWPAMAKWPDCVVYPVTGLQAGMLVATMKNPSSYVLQSAVHLDASVDMAKLQSAFQALVVRHEILRTAFASTSAGLFQVIRSDANDIEMAIVSATTIEEFLHLDSARGFELGVDHFVRWTVVKTESNTFGVMTIHHALNDGWTFPLLWEDLLSIVKGKALVDRPSFRHVVDFIEAQDKSETEGFWRSYLDGVVSSSIGTSGAQLHEEVVPSSPLCISSKASLAEITLTAQRFDVTVAELAKFAWAATLRKYTRHNDVVFGQVKANRDIPVDGVERYARIVFQFDDALPLSAMLESIRVERGVMTPFTHASLVDIKKWSGVEGELFDTLFACQTSSGCGASQGYWSMVERSMKTQFSLEYTFELIVAPKAGSLEINALYKPGFMSRDQAQWIMREFDELVWQLCIESPDKTINLWDVSPAQGEFIQNSTFGPEVPLPFELLHHAFESRALKHPELPAVEFEGQWLSYGELNAQANAVACELAELGVCVGSRVAVIMDRCLEFPIGLLATLKVGGAMMPLDVAFPLDRLELVLEDSGVDVLVTTDVLVGRLEGLSCQVVTILTERLALNPIAFSQLPCHIASSKDEAYLVYTSGSTGKPKGVPVLHQGVTNTIFNQPHGFHHICEGSRMLQVMAIGFDGCQWDLWKALSHGATLVLRGSNIFDILPSIDVVGITPTGLSHLGDPSQYPRLKLVAHGGEVMPSALKDLWADHVTLVNRYGPSEGAIETHVQCLSKGQPTSIGRPINNVTCRILDTSFRPVPVGVVGEIYLGGICVSPGYINRPDDSTYRFVSIALGNNQPPECMFRTGDLGRLLPNGHFEVLGREDTQVKLKGYRIELDEVANAMMQHPDVVSAAVIVKDKTHLVGFFSPANVNVNALRETVAALLPVYMVPAAWVGLDTLPQNTNGKIDVKVLATFDVNVVIEALESETEKVVATAWADVLGVDVNAIGRNTSFFALGGDSISVISAVAMCKKAGLFLTVAKFMETLVLWRVAAAATTASDMLVWPQATVNASVRTQIDDEWGAALGGGDIEVYPTTPLQGGMLFATAKDRHAYVHQTPLLIPSTCSLADVDGAFQTVVACHDILRTTFVSTSSGIFQILQKSQRDNVQQLPLSIVTTASLKDFLAEDLARGFALGDKSFVRLTLVSTERDGSVVAVLTIHHALYDGWSHAMLLNDLFKALQKRPIVSTRPSFRTVVDYIEAQDKVKAEAYWTTYFSALSYATLVNSLVRPSVGDEKHFLDSISIPLEGLTKAAQVAGSTVADVAKLAWAATLRKFTQRNDVVFGQVMANRDIPVHDAETIMGPLINIVPCRVTFDDAVSVTQLLQSMQAGRVASMAHSHAGLVDVKRWSGLGDSDNLFDTLFVYQNLPSSGDQDGFAIIENTAHTSHSDEYTFELLVQPSSTSLVIEGLFHPAMMTSIQAQMIVHEFGETMLQVTNCLVKAPSPVSELWRLGRAQIEVLQLQSSPLSPLVPRHGRLHQLFEHQAKSQPQARAIQLDGMWLTYGNLNAMSDALAEKLVVLGVSSEARVAVVMNRDSFEFHVSMLAVLKASGVVVQVNNVHGSTDEPVYSTVKLILLPANQPNSAHTSATTFHVNLADLNTPASPFEALTASSSSADCIEFTDKPTRQVVRHFDVIRAASDLAQELKYSNCTRVMSFGTTDLSHFYDTWTAWSCGGTVVCPGHDVLKSLESVDVLTGSFESVSSVSHAALDRVVVWGLGGCSLPTSVAGTSCRRTHVYVPPQLTRPTHVSDDQASGWRPMHGIQSTVVVNPHRQVPVGVFGDLYTKSVVENAVQSDNTSDVSTPTGDRGCVLPNGLLHVDTLPQTLRQAAVDATTAVHSMMNHENGSYLIYPATPLQAGLMFTTMQDPTTSVHQFAFRLKSLNVQRLSGTFQQLVAQNELLRTTFVSTPAGVFQVIHQTMSKDAKLAQVIAKSLDEFTTRDRERGFHVGDRMFLRMTVVATASSDRFLVLTMHHVLYDSHAAHFVMSDFQRLYQTLPVVPRPPFRHVMDFILAQDPAVTKAFWQTYLGGSSGTLLGVEVASTSFENTEPLCVRAATSRSKLAEIAAAANVTLATLVQFGWAATLRRYTRQTDIVFGQVLANRNIPVQGVERYRKLHSTISSLLRFFSTRMMGAVMSSVPSRVQFDANTKLATLLGALEGSNRDVIPHGHASLVDIKQWSGVEGELFNTLFAFVESQATLESQCDEFEAVDSSETRHTNTSDYYPYEVIVVPAMDDGLELHALASTNHMSWTHAHSILVEFDDLLATLANLPNFSEASVDVLDGLSGSQTHFINECALGPQVELPFALLHHGFEAHTSKYPLDPAVEFNGLVLTYGEVNDQSNKLARQLAELGAGVGSRVAVIMERCLEFPIAMLAVLKAGAAMIPLDATFPAHRLSYILDDADAVAVITTEANDYRIDEMELSIPVVYTSSNDLAKAPPVTQHLTALTSPKDEAYVVYTSGSTGHPKGVPVVHDAAVNVIVNRSSDIPRGSRVVQFMAIGFDGCQWETWKALSFGGTLVLRQSDVLATVASANVLSCTPTALALLGDPAQFPRLKVVAVGGEAMPMAINNLWASSHVTLLNCYGPTECAIESHVKELHPNAAVTIGAPIQNTACYILDKWQKPVPVGVEGEMYLGGVCVSPGYINRPLETESHFVPDPFAGGSMYRTGDIGRLQWNGEFEVIGRQDTQVKLKGYRIELDEVADAMQQHPLVTSAAVLVKNNTHLVGYYAPSTVSVDDLRAVVEDLLPPFMVPAVWMGMAELPQNANGKIDKKALARVDVSVHLERLESDTEKALAEIWATVLNIDATTIGRNTSFFAVGGDSISTLKVLNCMQRQLGMTKLTLSAILKHPKLSDMAALVVC
ncbi:hypothetical protein DYB37_005300, partial [Aphanomyces astaci]